MKSRQLIERLDINDVKYLPLQLDVEYKSDGDSPPTITERYYVADKDGNRIAEYVDKNIAKYVVESMNINHYSKKTKGIRDELKHEVIGTIVIDGEVVPKDSEVLPYMDVSSVVRYRKNADYNRYVNKFNRDRSKLWSIREDGNLNDTDIFLVILFYVARDNNKNIGDCIATIIDGLTESHILSYRRGVRVYGIAKSAFIKTDKNYRTEIYMMEWSKPL